MASRGKKLVELALNSIKNQHESKSAQAFDSDNDSKNKRDFDDENNSENHGKDNENEVEIDNENDENEVEIDNENDDNDSKIDHENDKENHEKEGKIEVEINGEFKDENDGENNNENGENDGKIEQANAVEINGQIYENIIIEYEVEIYEENDGKNDGDEHSNVDNIDENLIRTISPINNETNSDHSYHPMSNDSSDTESEVSELNEGELQSLDDKVGNNTEATEVGLKNRAKRARPETWKRNMTKKLRQSGQEYTNRNGKKVTKKLPSNVDCSKCRFHCNDNFPEELCTTLCNDYWSLGDTAKQKIFLATCVKTFAVKRRNVFASNARSISKAFFLPKEETQKCVCLKFLCSTLAFSHRFLDTLDLSSSGVYVDHDKRKGKVPPNKTKDYDVERVKEHINSFPRVESHYCRKKLKKLYLSSELNLSTMYRLYKNEFCINNNLKPVTFFVYDQIFHAYEPSFAFFMPKKDQCYVCNAYRNAIDKEPLREEFERHKNRENDSMKMKESDKESALIDNGEKFRAISFDLQAILTVPFAAENQLYYKRKLNVYNFTIFDSAKKDGFCYVWDECCGFTGSNEVGTCLIKYFLQLPVTVQHVAGFADTCGGQNRNKNICAAMLYAVNRIDSLKTIDIKFMESGHSYLDADSMHSTVERRRKHQKVYSTGEWAILIGTARINPRPYFINTLHNLDFYDLKKLATDSIHNTKHHINNGKKEIVHWLKIKWLRFEKSRSHEIQFKYNLNDSQFFVLDINDKRNCTVIQWKDVGLNPAYPSQLPISNAKKKDLLFLLEKKIIPESYRHYFENLPSASRLRQQNSDEEE